MIYHSKPLLQIHTVIYDTFTIAPNSVCSGHFCRGGFILTDHDYMQAALSLAVKGCGRVSPNPMVGAVIVKDGRIIGQGYHQNYGGLHAERNAFADCAESPHGATLYVTLEPCCHYGKTPPCTEAIIENKISRVVIGSPDPNPLVGGKGVKILREHGIEVTEGILEEECNRLNEVFLHYIRTKTPYVIMKYAMTMDGKIATFSGKSKWITGEASRKRVHEDRNRYSAIMVGVGTVLADNPMLNCRIPDGINPIRIICDIILRTPLASDIVKTARDIRTIIVCSCSDNEKKKPYLDVGCEIIEVPPKNGHIDLSILMKLLGAHGIDSIILEGGASLNMSALESGIVKKVQAYIAPKLFGGAQSKSPIGGMGIEAPDSAVMLSPPVITRIGDDILLESEVLSDVHGNN